MPLGLDVPTTLFSIVAIIIGLLVAMPAVRRGQSKATIELLRAELGVESTARKAQEERCVAEVAELRNQHNRELGEVQGKLAVMNRDFAKVIAAQVVEVLRKEGVIT